MKNKRVYKRFNQKGRQQYEKNDNKPLLDSAKLLDNSEFVVGDESTPIILPTKSNCPPKESGKVIQKKEKLPISKRQKKQLARILEQREKKQKRQTLISELAENNVDDDMLAQMISTVDVHSGNFLGQPMKKKRKSDNTDDAPKGSLCKRFVPRPSKRSVPAEGNNASDSVDTSDISTDEDWDLSKPLTSKPEMTSSVATVGPNSTSKVNNVIKSVILNTKSINEKAVVVARTEKHTAARKLLPILVEEHAIMEAVSDHDVIIVCGETGCGKTTQVPQFLYEAGYARNKLLIGVTEPRRVAAMSMSQRVGEEMNVTSKIVSYQIRHEGNACETTEIKFMTDGVLLKELQSDFLLNKYSVIVIDEAHERSVFTDVLIGLLSRIVLLRRRKSEVKGSTIAPLKLIIMSATLQVASFVDNDKLFRQTKPPVISVPARQFPVAVNFAKHTPDDYVAAAARKVVELHREMASANDDGAILVFVTGRNEVHRVLKRLSFLYNADMSNEETTESTKKLVHDKSSVGEHSDSENDERELSKIMADRRKMSKKGRQMLKARKTNKTNTKRGHTASEPRKLTVKTSPTLEDVRPTSAMTVDFKLDDFSLSTQNQSIDTPIDVADRCSDDSCSDNDDEEEDDSSEDDEVAASNSHGAASWQRRLPSDRPVVALPLYSMLSTALQRRIFAPPPPGCRLVVVATNVAETSLTIPNVRHVIDCGRVKKRVFDEKTGASAFMVGWCSKASAEQRKGRAGRTAAGHCHRLYSAAVFKDEFADFDEPEIVRRPVDDLVLQMKYLGVEMVVNFPFITPPSSESLAAAEKLLRSLGAVENAKRSQVTALGRLMAELPVAPRFARCILAVDRVDVMRYMLALVAALSVQEFLSRDCVVDEHDDDDTGKKFFDMMTVGEMGRLGDPGVALKVIGAVDVAVARQLKALNKRSLSQFKMEKICQEYGVRYKAYVESRKLRKQLTEVVNGILAKRASSNAGKVLCDTTGDDVDCITPPSDDQTIRLRRALTLGFGDRVARRIDAGQTAIALSKSTPSYELFGVDVPCFMHPKSKLAAIRPAPEYVICQELIEGNKPYLRNVTVVEDTWLADLLPQHCRFGVPLSEPAPHYDAKQRKIICTRQVTYGPQNWPLGPTKCEYPANGGGGTNVERIRLFAKYFVDGVIFEPLAVYRQQLLASPSLLLKPWARLNETSNLLLTTLAKRGVDTTDALVGCWKKDPSFLLDAYRNWLPSDSHSELERIWPPCDISLAPRYIDLTPDNRKIAIMENA